MSLDTATESVPSSDSAATATETPSTSGYSVTDPGYDGGGLVESSESTNSENDELAALIAENKKKKQPSETSDDASSETAEETETPSGDDSADPGDEISDELLDKAIELGFSLEDIKAFDSAKALEKEVKRTERIQQRLQEKAGKTQDQEKPTEQVVDDLEEPKWDELIALGHDPEVIALQKKNFEQIKQTRELTQQLLRVEQQRAFQAQCDRFDDALNAMEGFEEVLGKGRQAELVKAKETVQAENRQKVFTKMLMLRDAYERAGQPVPPESELIQEAVQASFYKHAQSIARNRLKGEIKKAGSQALSRPRSAQGKPLSGPSLALAKEREFWKKHS